MNLVQMSRSLSCFLFMPKALFYARLKPSRSVARDYARLSPFALHRQGLRSAKESVKKHDVERRTRRKTLSIFLCGFRGFCVVRDFFTRSKAFTLRWAGSNSPAQLCSEAHRLEASPRLRTRSAAVVPAPLVRRARC